MKILLLEDDVMLQEIIAEHLLERGFDVESFYDGNDALNAVKNAKFDLLLLDVNVNGLDGFSLLKRVREISIQIPAIFITSLQSATDLKHAFKMGADDYIKKPFDIEELDARVDNLRRRYLLDISKEIEIETDLFFIPDENLIKKSGSPFQLSTKQGEILHYLIKQSPHTVTIEELSYNLWEYENIPDNSTIRTYIKELRKIVGKEHIVTIRSQGYRYE